MTAGIPQAVLAKEAILNAVGQSSFDLHGHVDFPPWFHGPLLQARSQGPAPFDVQGLGYGRAEQGLHVCCSTAHYHRMGRQPVQGPRGLCRARIL